MGGGSSDGGGGGGGCGGGGSSGTYSSDTYIPSVDATALPPAMIEQRWAEFVSYNTVHSMHVVNNYDPVPRVLGNDDLGHMVRGTEREAQNGASSAGASSAGASGAAQGLQQQRQQQHQGNTQQPQANSLFAIARSAMSSFLRVVSSQYVPVGQFASLLGGGGTAEQAPYPLAPVHASLHLMPAPQLRKLLRTPPASVVITGQPLSDHSLTEYGANFRSAFSHACSLWPAPR
jgi:hypothetical protein